MIRQKTDNRTKETLSRLYIAAVCNSIHYFSWLLKGLVHKPVLVSFALLETDGPKKGPAMPIGNGNNAISFARIFST
jgi:hypothetical protein